MNRVGMILLSLLVTLILGAVTVASSLQSPRGLMMAGRRPRITSTPVPT